MTNRRISIGPALLIATGTILLLLGILLWQLDPRLDRLILIHIALDPVQYWASRVAWFTALGGFAVLGPVMLAVVAWLAWRRRFGDALWLFLTIASGRLIVEGLKILVQRPRPAVIDSLEIVKSYSFPSSHSAGTMLSCMALALLMPRRRPAMVLAAAAAMAIGWSRLALAVHWPSDVLAGFGFGLLWAGCAWLFLPSRS